MTYKTKRRVSEDAAEDDGFVVDEGQSPKRAKTTSSGEASGSQEGNDSWEVSCSPTFL